jgi:O-antigen ligase
MVFKNIITDLIKKDPKIKFFLYSYIFIFWIFLWTGINTLPEEINGFGESFIKSINALRIAIPTILSVVNFLFFFTVLFARIKEFKNYNIHVIFKNIYYLFLIYFILQSIGTYNNSYQLYNFDSLFLLYLGSGSVTLFLLIRMFKFEKIFKYLIYLTILIIIFVTIYISYISFKFTNLQDFDYYIYGINNAETKFLYQEMPRITGLSRLWGVISLFFLLFFYNYNKNNFIKYLIFFFIITLSLLIWAAQSRGTLLCYYLTVIFITLFSKIKKINKIYFLFIFIFLPIFIYQIYIFTKKINQNKINNHLNDKSSSSYIGGFIKILDNFDKSRVVNDKTSSGRIELWNEVLSKYEKKKIFGYGPQADRNLIGRELTRKYSNNVSNAYLYALICGGYLSLLIFILINAHIIINLYKSIFIKNLFLIKNNIETKYSAGLLFYFLIRTLIENSYSLYSIDFLLVIVSFSLINEFVNKKN